MIIIGGGPAGLLVARDASSLGAKVDLYEADEEPGRKACGGLVSKSGLASLDVDYKDAVLNEVSSAAFFSPSGRSFVLDKKKSHAVVLDRAKLAKEMVAEAESAGARINLGKRITRVPDDGVVGADGANSFIARSLGLETKKLAAFQVVNRMEHDTDMVELHFGSFAPGFFAWVIPISETKSRLGLAYDTTIARQRFDGYNPEVALRYFANKRGCGWDPVSKEAGVIPLYEGKSAVYEKIALVGDAASQVKASTGGGIVIGGMCARILGKVIGESRPLGDYEREWRERFGKELDAHRRIYDVYSRLSDQDFEELFDLVDDELLDVINRHADMENAVGLYPALLSYLSKHPLKAMKFVKFLH